MNKIIVIAILAVSFLLGPVAFSQGCPHRMHHLMTALKLDKAQQAKVEVIQTQLEQQEKTTWEQMSALRTQIREMVASDNMDESKLDSLISQKKELLASMMKAKLMAKNQIYNVLTASQKVKFQAMMKKMEEKMIMKYKNC